MPLVVTKDGKQIFLKAGLNNTAGQNQYMRLYSNDVTPTESSVAGDFTQASFSGYTQKSLTGSSWTITSTTPIYAYYAQQTWTFTGGPGSASTIYGYYIVQQSSGLLLLAERINPTVTLVYYNETLSITPKLYFK
jgi:hypothetical protein